MKILIHGLNYHPELVGIGPYTAGLAQGLAARGHSVTAVVGEPYYPEWRRRDEDGPSGVGVEDGVRVLRCPIYIPRDPGGAKRIMHHLSFAVSSLIPLLQQARRERPEWVFAVAPSLIALPSAWLAARSVGARLWLHIQDFEVEAAFATGLVKKTGIAARLARRLEALLFRLPDRFSSISPNMCAKLLAQGLAPERVVEMRNWADNALRSSKLGVASMRDEWTAGDRHIALYAGNIANKQGLEIVIEAARGLAARDDILFVICGEGPNRARLERLALGLNNVRFGHLQPRERLGDMLGAATVHLLPQIAGTADLVLPSKLTNMLASGRPVVAASAPGTSLTAELEGCGIAVRPGDNDAFAAAVVRLIDDPPLRAKFARRALAIVDERWRRETELDVFERAAGGGSRASFQTLV